MCILSQVDVVQMKLKCLKRISNTNGKSILTAYKDIADTLFKCYFSGLLFILHNFKDLGKKGFRCISLRNKH